MRSSIWISAGLALALALWLGTGRISAGVPGEERPPAPAAAAGSPGLESGRGREAAVGAGGGPRVAVEVRSSTAQPVVREVVVQGALEPLRTVRVRAETKGRVASVEVEKGSRVEGGRVLARLAMEDREARLREARARVRQREAELEAARALGARGMQAKTRVAEAEALWEAARAEEARVRLEIARTRIRAPFAGVVHARPVEVGDYLDRGDVVAEVVDDSRLLATGEVPQASAARVRVGMPARVRLLGGEVLEGTVRYRAPVGSDETRTFRVEIECPNPDRALAGGLSAELRIPVEAVQAHFVPLSLLVLGPEGGLGIKVVDEDDRVAFRPVEVVRTSARGAWVRGLGEQARIITVGQGFVQPGEIVRIVAGDGAPPGPRAGART